MSRQRVSLDTALADRLRTELAGRAGVSFADLLDSAVKEYLANGLKDMAAAHVRLSALEAAADRVALFLEGIGEALRRDDYLTMARLLREPKTFAEEGRT